MKSLFYILICILTLNVFSVKAQWSTDPENPGIVCDYTGFQNSPQAFDDDNGGIFVFWLDNRLNSTQGTREIYGQHFDSDGYALWEEDGRQIISHYNKLNWFGVSRIFNGEIIIGWVSSSAGYPYGDSMRVQRLDDNGYKVWSADLTVGNAAASPSYILSIDSYKILHDNSGYCISIGVVYYGGSNGNRITRFTSNGNLTGWYNGEPEGTQYYYGSSGLLSAYDADNNIYLYYSGGNGAGAGLYCLKVNVAGDTIWGPVNVLEGTSGLSYQFYGISDVDGITFVWQGNSVNAENLYARRLTTDGILDWSGSTLTICDAEGSQSNFYMKRSGNFYYIAWADGRPGVSPGYFDIYAQKFDISQNIYWAANGIEVSSLNTYIPYPKFEFSDNNSMIVCYQSTVAGFVAQKVLDDGTLEWDEDGNQICITTYNPFYAEHIELRSQDNVVAVWAKSNPSGGADDIYISRIDYLGITSQKNIIDDQIEFYPNPASEKVVISLPDNFSNPEINIIDSFGKVVITSYSQSGEFNGRFDISTSGLPSGIYILQVKSGIEIKYGKLMIN